MVRSAGHAYNVSPEKRLLNSCLAYMLVADMLCAIYKIVTGSDKSLLRDSPGSLKQAFAQWIAAGSRVALVTPYERETAVHV